MVGEKAGHEEAPLMFHLMSGPQDVLIADCFAAAVETGTAVSKLGLPGRTPPGSMSK